MLEALLAEGCARFGVPGAQLGLLRDGRREVLCAGVLSEASRFHRVTPGTAFHAGSIAKPLAATLALDAAARGELDLGAPGPGGWDDPLRELIGHTSGRPNVLPGDGEPIEAFVSRVGAMGRATPPGRFAYCNAGWAVVDLALEAATGMGFEALAAERVLGPLGVPARLRRRRATRSRTRAGARSLRRPRAAAPRPPAAAGGRPRRTCSPTPSCTCTRAAASSSPPRSPSSASRTSPSRAAPSPTRGRRAGRAGTAAATARSAGRASPGHRAYLRVYPEQDAALVLLTNAAGPLLGGSGGSALFDDLLPRALGALGVPAPGAPDDGREPTPAAALAGVYGPAAVEADGEAITLAAPAMGIAPPVRHERVHGDTFLAAGAPPGGMAIAFDGDLLYLGPFAVPRAS